MAVFYHYFQNIINSETWVFNLTKANTNATVNPDWFKLYSFKDIYGVESLTPTEMDKLTHRLAANRSLLEEYSRYLIIEVLHATIPAPICTITVAFHYILLDTKSSIKNHVTAALSDSEI
jgi:hypothetical protein